MSKKKEVKENILEDSFLWNLKHRQNQTYEQNYTDKQETK